MEADMRPIASPEDLAGTVASWCRSRPVRLCVLYGSRARRQERPASDLDLALWASPLPVPVERLTWRRELAEVTRLPVQLVFITPDLDPVLGNQIAREGRVLYQEEPDAWPRERLRLWQLYQDSLPFLRASRRRLRGVAEKVRGGA